MSPPRPQQQLLYNSGNLWVHAHSRVSVKAAIPSILRKILRGLILSFDSLKKINFRWPQQLKVQTGPCARVLWAIINHTTNFIAKAPFLKF